MDCNQMSEQKDRTAMIDAAEVFARSQGAKMDIAVVANAFVGNEKERI